MTNDPKGESFRIGDLRRPEVRGRQRQAEPSAAEPTSVGFPAIEHWLERGSIEEVVAAMRPRYEVLETMSTGGTIQQRGSAKKAMGAYERAADLFEYLFATKEVLQGPKDG